MDNEARIDLILKALESYGRGPSGIIWEEFKLLACVGMSKATFITLFPTHEYETSKEYPKGMIQRCILTINKCPGKLLMSGDYHVIIKRTQINKFYTIQKMYPILEEPTLKLGIVKVRLWDTKTKAFEPV